MRSVINNFFSFFSCKQQLTKMKYTIKKLEEKVQTQNNLLNNVSHEIRTPMHGIYNISEFLNDHWNNLNEDQKKSQVQSITDVSSWLKNFINNLLDISKFQSGKMTFDFTETNLISLIQQTIEYNIKLQLFNNSKLQIIFDNNNIDKANLVGDPFRIRQILQNLLDNAIKYTECGIILVKIISITYNSKPAWQVDVIDEGIGIPQDEIKIIFDSFVRSSTKYGIGTGLGLSICREIVEAHGGIIWAENNDSKNNNINYSKGATFSFILPSGLQQLANR